MGPIGAQEMILIVLVALLLFGPKKLPELGRMLGKGLSEFRRAKSELKATFETHMQELDREARAAEQAKNVSNASPSLPEHQTASYPYPYDEYGRQSSTYESSAEPYGHLASSSLPDSSHNASAPPAESRQTQAENFSPPVPGTVARSTLHSSGRVPILRDEERPA